MTRRHGWPCLVLGFGTAVLLGLAARVAAQEECASCHEDVVKAFRKTGHAERFAADKAYQAASCVSCHTGAEEHVASSGEKKPLNPAKGSAREANASCLTCHESTPAQAHWQGSPHQLAGTKCASCHDVHGQRPGAPVLAKGLPGAGATTQTCLRCHGNVRASLHQRSTHPLRDGRMECVSCHQNMRGPFLWEHSPVREDCLTCHKPHGSNYPSMLQARATQLCQSCHQQGRHQTVPGLPASTWVSNKACLNCHQQIHGSNHPSGPLFQR